MEFIGCFKFFFIKNTFFSYICILLMLFQNLHLIFLGTTMKFTWYYS